MAMGKMFLQKRRVGRPRKITRPVKYVSSTVKSYVQNAINRSKDFKEKTTNDTTATTTTARFVLLNGIGQGDGDTARGSDEIKMKSVQSKGYLRNEDSTDRRVRIIWFIMKQPNGSAPTNTGGSSGNDLLDNTSGYNGALKNLDSRQFIILKDMFINLNPTGEPGSEKMINFYKKIFNKTQYNGDGSTITAINSGAVYYFIQSSDDSAGITVNLFNRVRFQE